MASTASMALGGLHLGDMFEQGLPVAGGNDLVHLPGQGVVDIVEFGVHTPTGSRSKMGSPSVIRSTWSTLGYSSFIL